MTKILKKKNKYAKYGKTEDMKRDKKLPALEPGKRKTKHGSVYYETRQNRSDIRYKKKKKKK